MTGAATLNVSANVATVTLVNESRLNAIDIAMARDLVRLAQQLVTRDDIQAKSKGGLLDRLNKWAS